MSVIKLIIILLFVTIIISMASALFYLVKDQGKSKRVVKALTVRIILSVTAFFLLMVAYAVGLITPNE